MAWLKTRTNDDGALRYTGMYRDIRGRERSAGTFDSKRTAKRAAQRFENDVRGGRVSDPKKGRQTLRQYVETQWLPNHVIEDTTAFDELELAI